MAFEEHILRPVDPEGPFVKAHILLLDSVFREYARGGLITKAQGLDAMEAQMSPQPPAPPFTLSVDSKQDLNAMLAAIDAEPTLIRKLELVDDLTTVLLIAEGAPSVTIYDTRAKLKERLSWL